MVTIFKNLKANENADFTKEISSQTSVEFKNNNLQNFRTKDSYREILKLIVDNKMGQAFITEPKQERKLLENARTAAKWGTPITYSLAGPSKTEKPLIYDQQLISFPWPSIFEKAQDFIVRARKYHKDMQASFSFSKEERQIIQANTEGFSDSYESTRLAILISLNLVQGQNILSSYEYLNHTHLEELNWQDLQERLFTNIEKGMNNVELASASYPVIFTPQAAKSLLSPILACINGLALTRGFSPWQKQLDKKIFNKDISLFNDGLLDKGIASRPFDREGVPSQSFAIIEEGYLKNFLLNLESASKLKMSARGTSGLNGPESNNLIMKEGQKDHEELISNIKNGVLILSTMGAWAGNPYGGQVSGNIALGYKIKDGKIQGRIKDAMFSLNVFQALKEQIKEISSDRLWVGNALLPYLLFDRVNIATKR